MVSEDDEKPSKKTKIIKFDRKGVLVNVAKIKKGPEKTSTEVHEILAFDLNKLD